MGSDFAAASASGSALLAHGGGSMSRSLCGEMMFTYAKGRGIAGMVVADYHSGNFHQDRHRETYCKLAEEKGIITF